MAGTWVWRDSPYTPVAMLKTPVASARISATASLATSSTWMWSRFSSPCPKIRMLRSRASALVSVRRVTEVNAGRTTAGVDEIFVRLDLDYVAGMSRWTDPPQAGEFYGKSAKPEIDQFVDDWVEKRGQHQRE